VGVRNDRVAHARARWLRRDFGEGAEIGTRGLVRSLEQSKERGVIRRRHVAAQRVRIPDSVSL
jgi:hypothetical protein